MSNVFFAKTMHSGYMCGNYEDKPHDSDEFANEAYVMAGAIADIRMIVEFLIDSLNNCDVEGVAENFKLLCCAIDNAAQHVDIYDEEDNLLFDDDDDNDDEDDEDAPDNVKLINYSLSIAGYIEECATESKDYEIKGAINKLIEHLTELRERME